MDSLRSGDYSQGYGRLHRIRNAASRRAIAFYISMFLNKSELLATSRLFS
ncbi:protein of unknown function [Candidatus Nitrosocosmicus franklandus]|uniref:Uncharacterized protein n=1 Tax=Candidatus Nitrosocosmicus franklandianus TaxID=1798806 RepID=A0A484ICR3_9ARCH|nr:protein of unknown function [Candidatus Nitrosocosmicus franklandus]